MAERYYTAVVISNRDDEKRGRLELEIPGLLGPGGRHPDLIEPRLPLGGGPGAVGAFFIPPEGSVVVVEATQAGALRWLGSTLGSKNTLPDLLTTDYPKRAGMTSPDGTAVLVLAPSLAVLQADDTRLGSSSATSKVSLAPLTDAQLDALKTALDSWTPVPADGGAALKVILTALFVGGWPASTAATKVSAV